jgi:glutathione S-transferase
VGDYKLYCFGESGNAYKAALMLALCQIKWEPVFVDFFNGETRSPSYRSNINEMGEVPVLVHEERKLTQSGVILDYLAERTRKFGAKSGDERREIWR